MIVLQDLTKYLNQLLNIENIPDYCPNGLQVQGNPEINKIVTGVTACQQLLDAAVRKKADAIIVHHGYFWKGENDTVTGIKRNRLQTLLKNDMSLLAYHLPLDAHKVFGNNVQLAKVLDFKVDGPMADKGDKSLVFIGRLQQPMTGEELSHHINSCLQRQPLHINGRKEKIETIAWCTGAAQRMIDFAIDAKVDAYLSGEISEHTVHSARESGIHYFSAGHHATERYGIKALGEHLEEKFHVELEFVDIDNPV